VTSSPAVLIGDSEPMRRLRSIIERVAPSRVPVLIAGATGTGKEVVATMLHQLSGRSGALVAFNVCAVADTMFEDALFGHARGAYTGASGDALGFLREANGGTAFFDEIGGLPLPLQAKLLRAVETGVFRPIGTARDAQSDFRTLAASNEPLGDLVTAGRFRIDLAHRLSGFVITVPALAERMEDIPALAMHFAARVRPGWSGTVTGRALRLLQGSSWPGNVRELKQVVESAMVFAGADLDAEAIRVALAHRIPAGVQSEASAEVYSVARRRLESVLEQFSWNTERVAASLGVHRTTIYRRMRRLGLDFPPVRCTPTSADRSPSDGANGAAPFALISANVHGARALPANEAG
jgi:DNA-binding NtrC family response regulator